MSQEPQWETIEVSSGSFVGWGTTAGQHVTGKVLSYSPSQGTDFNNEPCPQLTIELSDRAASFNKEGQRTDYQAGELVNLTVGQVGLKNAVTRAGLEVGDLVKITMTGTSKTNRGNTIKNFDLKVARGGGNTPPPQQQRNAQPQQQQSFEEEPPF